MGRVGAESGDIGGAENLRVRTRSTGWGLPLMGKATTVMGGKTKV